MRNLLLPTMLAALVWTIGGCGGGASVTPSVSVKLSSLDSGVVEKTKTDSNAAPPVKGFGTLEGRVALSGVLPQLSPLTVNKDPEVCAVAPIPDESLVVGENNGVANVFVYIKKVPGGDHGEYQSSGDKLVFDQKQCTFTPHAMIVPCNKTIEILNADPIPHNTRNTPKTNTSVNYLVGGNVREGGPTIIYEKPEREPVAVKCDYHAWMTAYQFPVDHPFVALTGTDGKYRIENIPSGTHQFQFWHERAGGYIKRNVKVTIKADETATLDIDYAGK